MLVSCMPPQRRDAALAFLFIDDPETQIGVDAADCVLHGLLRRCGRTLSLGRRSGLNLSGIRGDAKHHGAQVVVVLQRQLQAFTLNDHLLAARRPQTWRRGLGFISAGVTLYLADFDQGEQLLDEANGFGHAQATLGRAEQAQVAQHRPAQLGIQLGKQRRELLAVRVSESGLERELLTAARALNLHHLLLTPSSTPSAMALRVEVVASHCSTGRTTSGTITAAP